MIELLSSSRRSGLTKRSSGRRAVAGQRLALKSKLMICMKPYFLLQEVSINLQRLSAAENKCRYAAESAKLACTAYEGVEQDSTLEGRFPTNID